jgi:hypothetical protein
VPPQGTPPEGNAQLYANSLVGADPATPIFQAAAGQPSRLAFVFPGGTTINNAQRPFVVTLHGHVWQEEPYRERSTIIGNNPLSQWFGTQTLSPYENLNLVLPQSGGKDHVSGDYLYSTYQQANVIGLRPRGIGGTWATGTWGLLRVNAAAVSIEAAQWTPSTKQVTVKGTASQKTKTVQIAFKTQNAPFLQQKLVPVTNGAWNTTVDQVAVASGTILTAVSSDGAVNTAEIQVPGM